MTEGLWNTVLEKEKRPRTIDRDLILILILESKITTAIFQTDLKVWTRSTRAAALPRIDVKQQKHVVIGYVKSHDLVRLFFFSTTFWTVTTVYPKKSYWTVTTVYYLRDLVGKKNHALYIVCAMQYVFWFA
jgi:hypothetical protein